jgi:aldose 1-epimerase
MASSKPRRTFALLVPALVLLGMTGCKSAKTTMKPTVTSAPFGTTPDGKAVEIFTMKNSNGLEVHAMTYGAIITSIKTPDETGKLGDIVLGFDSLGGYTNPAYIAHLPYFGAVVGRYANRIAGGKFSIDGTQYQLPTNDGPNSLHGGTKGFDQRVWDGTPFQNDTAAGVVLTYTSPDGQEGYPGTLNVQVTYTLTNSNELVVDYHATTDKPTIVNLAQHSYWNLENDGKTDILTHKLMINADSFTPIDSTFIPTGKIEAVAGTPFDFRTPKEIGRDINEDNQQLKYAKGYDDNWVLNKTPTDSATGLTVAAEVWAPTTGRTLEVLTNQPGIQFYSGNFLDGTITGKDGITYGHRAAFALETQHFPDSPNHPDFPSTVLRPGEQYNTRTIFRFGVESSGS